MTDRPLAEIVAELRALEAQASPVPWSAEPRSDTVNIMSGRRAVARCQRKVGSDTEAALIAAARNALPALLAAAERVTALEAENARLQEVVIAAECAIRELFVSAEAGSIERLEEAIAKVRSFHE